MPSKKRNKGRSGFIDQTTKFSSEERLAGAPFFSGADIEKQPYTISFVNYNEKLCQVSDMKAGQARNAIDFMKRISKCKSVGEFKANGVGSVPISNSGEYKKLFNGLDSDVEIKEHKISGPSRFFYSILPSKKIIRAIAITGDKHFETKKNF